MLQNLTAAFLLQSWAMSCEKDLFLDCVFWFWLVFYLTYIYKGSVSGEIAIVAEVGKSFHDLRSFKWLPGMSKTMIDLGHTNDLER